MSPEEQRVWRESPNWKEDYALEMAHAHPQPFKDQEAMSKDDAPETLPVRVDVLRYLWGVGALEGSHFGETPAGKGAFWWRKHLPALPKPVDPLEQAVDDAWALLPPEWTRETFVKCVADTLRARGVTLKEGDA